VSFDIFFKNFFRQFFSLRPNSKQISTPKLVSSGHTRHPPPSKERPPLASRLAGEQSWPSGKLEQLAGREAKGEKSRWWAA